jgi:hypothetical protein
MDTNLKAIKDGWEKRDARGQRSSTGKANLADDDKVRGLADKYVKAHTKDFAGWENLSLESLVRLVDEAREVGDEEKLWKVEAYLLHKFEPQNIGGTYEPKLRVSNGS